jgi:hypothetical protein
MIINLLGFLPDCQLYIYEGKGKHTSALKEMSEPLKVRILRLSSGIEASTMHTKETHWFLLRESPTNTNLLFLSFSSNAVALNLFRMAEYRHHENSLNCLIQ